MVGPASPPSLLCGVLVLHVFEEVGDEETVERLRFDLRWKVALSLPLDFAGFVLHHARVGDAARCRGELEQQRQGKQ